MNESQVSASDTSDGRRDPWPQVHLIHRSFQSCGADIVSGRRRAVEIHVYRWSQSDYYNYCWYNDDHFVTASRSVFDVDMSSWCSVSGGGRNTALPLSAISLLVT